MLRPTGAAVGEHDEFGIGDVVTVDFDEQILAPPDPLPLSVVEAAFVTGSAIDPGPPDRLRLQRPLLAALQADFDRQPIEDARAGDELDFVIDARDRDRFLADARGLAFGVDPLSVAVLDDCSEPASRPFENP